MRSPSTRILNRTVTIYPATKGQDRNGGPSYSYTTASRVMICMIQPRRYREEFGPDGRITEYRQWYIYTATNPAVSIRDKVVFDQDGVTSTAYVQSSRNEGGASAMFSILCTERL